MRAPDQEKRENFWEKHGNMTLFLHKNIPGFDKMQYREKVDALTEYFFENRLNLETRVHDDILEKVPEDFLEHDCLGRDILAISTEMRWNGNNHRTDLCILQKGILENCELQRSTSYNPKTKKRGKKGVNLYTKTKNYCVGFSEKLAYAEKDFEEILEQSASKKAEVKKSEGYKEELDKLDGKYLLDGVKNISSLMIPFAEGRCKSRNYTHKLLSELRDSELDGKKLHEYYAILYLASPPEYFAIVNEEKHPGLTKLLNS